jgi:hypothetical protein
MPAEALIEWKPGTGLGPSEISIEDLEADFWGASSGTAAVERRRS